MTYAHAPVLTVGPVGPERRTRSPLRTALAFIRLAERRNRVPRDDRLEKQPCEVNR